MQVADVIFARSIFFRENYQKKKKTPNVDHDGYRGTRELTRVVWELYGCLIIFRRDLEADFKSWRVNFTLRCKWFTSISKLRILS